MKKMFLSDEHLEKMLETEPLYFGTEPDINDNRPSTFSRALAFFMLVLHERETDDGRALKKIREQLAFVTSEGRAPNFDAICLWCYCPLSAAVALSRVTPKIWDSLDGDVKERLSFMMEMYLYLESFATADCNEYHTGPALGGNYYKNWNPNYRLANVPAMVFAACFFGEGDMKKGEKCVNAMLHAFDSAKYDEIIKKMEVYGWERAKTAWTTPGRIHEDGSVGASAREILVFGGPTYSLDYTHSYVTKDAGTGLGVSCGGNDYLYNGYPLSRSDGIIEHLLNFNYSGGEVKSEHRFDLDEDGIEERIAWILDESHSPVEGKIGMMKEFASGSRSSAGYCSHDFQLSTCLIAAAKSLGIYDVTQNLELWERVKVGNCDFLYKNEIGYQGFAKGSYGTSVKTHSEKDEADTYFTIKYLWQNSINQ